MIGSSTSAIPAGLNYSPTETMPAADTPAKAGADSQKQAIAGYYSHLSVQTPIYEEENDQSVVDTPEERVIHEQLQALADRIKLILVRNNSAAIKESAGQLDKFVDEIKNRGNPGRLSCEEAHYFYSAAFKGKLERDIAKADLATGDDIGPATSRLETLCGLMGRPAEMFGHVVTKTIIADLAKSFKEGIENGLPPGLAAMDEDPLTPLPANLPPALQALADRPRAAGLPDNARPV